MPAVSKKQQKFMGMVHALNKGEIKPSDVSKDVQDVAKDMKKKDAKDFASTKHKGLPLKKEQSYRYGSGDVVKDVNPTCPHFGAVGKVKKVKPNSVVFIVTNKGKNFKPGQELEKSHDQMKKIDETINEWVEPKKFNTNFDKALGLVIKQANNLKGQLAKHPVKRHINKLKAIQKLYKKFIAPALVNKDRRLEKDFDFNRIQKYLKDGKFKSALEYEIINKLGGRLGNNSFFMLDDKEDKLLDKLRSEIHNLINIMDKAQLENINEMSDKSKKVINKLNKKEKEMFMTMVDMLGFDQVMADYKRDKKAFKQALKDMSESINEVSVSQVRSTLSRVKKQLMKKWAKKGGYENFGQKELRKMKDKLDYNPYGSPQERQISKMLDAFNDWAMNYSGDMSESMSPSQLKKMRDEFEKTGDLPPHLKKFVKDVKILKKKHKVKNIVVPGLEWMSDMSESINERSFLPGSPRHNDAIFKDMKKKGYIKKGQDNELRRDKVTAYLVKHAKKRFPGYFGDTWVRALQIGRGGHAQDWWMDMYSDIKRFLRESVNEDGHTDVASAKRKAMVMVDDVNDLLNKLNGMNTEDSLPSWLSDKITLSQNYISKAKDYLLNPVEAKLMAGKVDIGAGNISADDKKMNESFTPYKEVGKKTQIASGIANHWTRILFNELPVKHRNVNGVKKALRVIQQMYMITDHSGVTGMYRVGKRKFMKSVVDKMDKLKESVNESKMRPSLKKLLKQKGYEPIFQAINNSKSQLKQMRYSRGEIQDTLIDMFGNEDPKILQKIKESVTINEQYEDKLIKIFKKLDSKGFKSKGVVELARHLKNKFKHKSLLGGIILVSYEDWKKGKEKQAVKKANDKIKKNIDTFQKTKFMLGSGSSLIPTDKDLKMLENKIYKVGDTVSLLSFDRRHRGKAKVKGVTKSRPNKFGIKNHYITNKGTFSDMEVEGTEAYKLRFKGDTEKKVMKALNSPYGMNEATTLNDKSIGTKNYKGVGWFWPMGDWKHYLRDVENAGRKEVHDLWLKAGFEVKKTNRGNPYIDVKPNQKRKASAIVDKLDRSKKFKIESVNEIRNKREAETLIQQLGGNKFKMMTGAKNFGIDGKSLTFSIGRNSKGVNFVRIKLSSRDLYDMEFAQLRAGQVKVKSKEKGVYADQLGKMFKKHTGMNVRLF